MHLFWLLLLSAVCVGHGGLLEFAEMIQCVQPGVNPFIYNNYGCYCGLGGGGSPVDLLDECCMDHDNCYSKWGDLAYGTEYKFSCLFGRVHCSGSNEQIQAGLCECDRVAAHCFAWYQKTYYSAYKDYDRNKC